MGCWKLNDEQITSIILHQTISSLLMSRLTISESTISKIPTNKELREITLNGISQ